MIARNSIICVKKMVDKLTVYGRIFSFLSVVFLCVLLSACNESEPFPRPLGYPRIDLPVSTSYTQFESEQCPFTFEYPDFGRISREKEEECWVDIQFKDYSCKWHITYRDIPQSGKGREVHFEEHRTLIYKHIKKASEITPNEIATQTGYGVLHEVYGNVGTPAYVFLSDSADQQLVMATFYFQTALKNDSLAPVINYMKGQLSHMLETLEWKN